MEASLENPTQPNRAPLHNTVNNNKDQKHHQNQMQHSFLFGKKNDAT